MMPTDDREQVSRLRHHLALLFPSGAGGQDVPTDVGEEQVKRAFRRLALECHPDRLRSRDPEDIRRSQARFIRAQEAFHELQAYARRGSPPPAPAPRIIAVGGAKGGVGKSTLAASLATALATMGHRVVAADLDLGGADLHLFLGIRRPQRSLGDLLSGRAGDLAACLEPAGIATLSVLAGDSAYLGSANLGHAQRQKVLRLLRRLPADFVVLDLGGDTTFNTLDFFLLADDRLVVTTADPASVLDAYGFIKVGVLRALARYIAGRSARAAFSPEAEERLERFVAASARPGGPTIPALLAELSELDGRALEAVRGVLGAFVPKLVLNLADETGGRAVIERIRQVCRQNLDLDVELCHLVPADRRIAQATRRLENVIGSRSDGAASSAIWALAAKLAEDDRPSTVRVSALERRFFEPPELFRRLPGLLDPLVRRVSGAGRPLSAWVAGRDHGESAYSFVIALAEAAARFGEVSYRVWASLPTGADAAEASRGVYPSVFLHGVPPATVKRHFLRGVGLSGGFCQVRESVRSRVTFVEAGASAPSGEPFDLVVSTRATDALDRDVRVRLSPAGLLISPGASTRVA